ncbi:MAG: DUF4194 domain-containing protein [Lachnospiraceae bacterium]|nr:DUF4194 domain-containing protein [Lachnospiraceae bacterium]
MLAYIKELSTQEQEEMRDVLQKLYRQTFILERRYDRRAGRIVINKEYYFCEKHMDFLKEYLEAAGMTIQENSELGTIYIQGEPVMGERLPKLATIYLLLLKLIYGEKMAEVSSSVNIVTTLGDLTAKAGEFGLIKSLTSQAEMKRALNVLKRYQMIEVMDSMEELNNQTRILIFPSINVVLMREDIIGLLDLFASEASQEEPEQEEAGQEETKEGEITDGE